MRRFGKTCALVLAVMVIHSASAGTSSTAAPTEAASAFTEVTLMRGSIIRNIIATGSLRHNKEESLKLPEALTIQSLGVKAGDTVQKGQILARYDTAVLKESLKEAKAALTAQDETIAQLLSQQESEQKIRTSIAGVVKQLNLKAGQMVQQTLQDQPAAILSANGLMRAKVIPSQTLSLGQAVKVRVGTSIHAGSVARLEEDGGAVVTFPDSKANIDESVQIILNGVTVGEGKAQVDLPYLLYTRIDGVVASVPVKVNSAVGRNATIFMIQNAAPLDDYLDALADREEMVRTISRLEELLANPVFVCESDGIVAEVTAQENTALQKESELLRLYAGNSFALDVSVDELDILSVQAGQEGLASLDAIPDEEFPVKVEKISPLGTSSGGITSYTVTLSIREDSRLLSGMNGTLTLTVGEARDSVLVPLAALMSDRGGNFVLLKGESEAAGIGAQGVKTYVKVGLSDANFAAVIEGLNEGDVVLVRPSALTESTGTPRQNQPGFGIMMGPDRQFNPDGGQRP